MTDTCFSIALNGYAGIYRECLASQARYTKRHDYQFWIIEDVPWKLSATQCAWLKVEILRGLLSAGAAHVAFLDADCEVRDHAPRFQSEFQSHATMLLAPGKSGRVNSGVIFARSDPANISFLDSLIANAEAVIPKPDSAPYENGHFIHYGKAFSGLGHIDHRTWNNNSTYDETSYIQHFSDGELRKLHQSRRVSAPERMRLKLEKYAQRFRDRWKPSAEQLSIPEFIKLARAHFEPEYIKWGA